MKKNDSDTKALYKKESIRLGESSLHKFGKINK